MTGARPPAVHIVLVGGGHAHVQVMTRIARACPAGVRVTLITRDPLTPYSGMLPGHVAGLYSRDAIHIDLIRLARATGIDLILGAATAIDRANRTVAVAGHAPVAYDLLSLDVGITPDQAGIAGADAHAIPVKPIGDFLARLDAVSADAARPDGPRRIAVVGGGAAGVELVLAVRVQLRSEAVANGRDPDGFAFSLVTSAPLVPSLNGRARARVAAALAERGVTVHGGRRVAAIDRAAMVTDTGERFPADAVLVATGARAPAWLAASGLPVADDGSVTIRPTLQLIGDDRVFAAGDCALLVGNPRPKAGVFAVRQGPVLADNLLAAATGRPLAPYRPQRKFLVLLSTADGSAIGARGRWLAVSGRWVWAWKDLLDRRFMARFSGFRA